MTPNALNAAPVSSMSDSSSDCPAAHPFRGTDAASEIAEALRSAVASTSSGQADDTEATLHEHLAALVQALASEKTGEPVSEVEEPAEEFVPPDVAEQRPPEAYDAGPEARHPENHGSQDEVEAAPAAAESDLVPRRMVGFAAGLMASVAVGGGMLLFEIGMSEPPAAAGNHAPKFQSRLADVSSATIEAPQPAEAPHAGEKETGAASATGITSLAANTPIAEVPMVPGPTADRGEPDAIPLKLHGTLVSVPGVAIIEDSKGIDRPERSPAAEITKFETTIEPATSESGQALPPTAVQPSSEPKPIELAAAEPHIAHVVMHVNMRAGPSNGQAVLAIIPEGSPVQIIQCGQWCEVSFGGQQGWIYREFISIAGPDETSIN